MFLKFSLEVVDEDGVLNLLSVLGQLREDQFEVLWSEEGSLGLDGGFVEGVTALRVCGFQLDCEGE